MPRLASAAESELASMIGAFFNRMGGRCVEVEIARDEGEKARELVGAARAEGLLEAALGEGPELLAGLALGAAELGDDDTPHALVLGIGLEHDKSVPLERSQIMAERRAVHAELVGELVDGGGKLAAA